MDPLASEPIRDNVLLLPQILKEVSSLEQYIAKIQQTLQESEAIVEKDKEDKKAKLALQEETASPSPAKKDKGATNAVKTTSQVYMTQGPLPKRFEEPCNAFPKMN